MYFAYKFCIVGCFISWDIHKSVMKALQLCKLLMISADRCGIYINILRQFPSSIFNGVGDGIYFNCLSINLIKYHRLA